MNNSDPKVLFDLRLNQLLRRVQVRLLTHGALRFLAAGLSASLAVVWVLGGPGEPGVYIGTGIGLTLAAGLLLLLWRFLLRPWRRLRRCRDLVRFVEERGSFANLLISAEEASRIPERWHSGDAIARELKRRLYERAVRILELLTPALVYPVSHRLVTGLALVLTLAVGSGLFIAVPGEMSRGLSRLVDPIPERTAVRTGGLYGATGPDFVVAGEDYEIAALDFAGGLEATVCEIRSGNGAWRSVPVRMEWIYPEQIGAPAPGRRWLGGIEAVHEDFSWRFRRGSLVTDEREVGVRHHPLLTRLGARVQPPAYMDLPAQDLARLPSWIEVPTGSTLLIEAEANHSLIRGQVVTSVGEPLTLAVNGSRGEARWDVHQAQSFQVELVNEYGLKNQSPVRYEVAVADDLAPVVRLERPDDDGVLPIDGELVLRVEATDDFGLDELALLVRVVSDTGATIGRGSGRGSDPETVPEDGWQGGVFWPSTVAAGSAEADPWTTHGTGNGAFRVRSRSVGTADPGLGVRLELEVLAGALDLVAGDALELVVQARDNRRPGPAGTTRSRVLRLVLPSAADVLTEQALAAEEQKSDLEEMRRRGRELGADLDRLNRELMKNPLPDWARQQEMEAALQRQKAFQEELSRVAEGISQELDRLAENQLTSPELLDKADEVSSLLEKSFSDQLQDLLRKMEESDSRATPEEVARAVQEVARDQKEMARRLDAALAMLERMSQEQELEGLTALLEQVMRKQQELAELSRKEAEQAADPNGEKSEAGDQGEQADPNDPSDSADSSDSPDSSEPSQQAEKSDQAENTPQPSPEELARRQEALARELDDLRQKMEQALENLENEGNDEAPSEAGEQYEKMLKEALASLEEQIKKGSMSKAAEEMQNMDPEAAAKMQQESMRDLGALYHVLMKTQQAMEMAMQNQQVSSLRSLAADLLALSAKQEAIAAQIPLRLREVRSQEMTRGEHRLQKAAAGIRDRLSELMDESPRQIMALLGKLDDLIEEMGRCVGAMNENRGSQARHHASTSLGQANSIVIHLLTQAQTTGGGGGGGSNPMPSASEQLQKMAREQAGLNGTTEQIREMLANRGISQKMRSQMKRLGEAQGSLAAQLEELARQERENPQGERILGDMEELGRRMEQVSREMDQGLVSEETLVRQDRILSRLLDARNSVRRRDYSQRRESHAADLLFEQQAGRGAEAESGVDTRQRLRFQPLNKAPLEYRDLVRRYYSALDSLDRVPGAPLGGPEPGQKIQ